MLLQICGWAGVWISDNGGTPMFLKSVSYGLGVLFICVAFNLPCRAGRPLSLVFLLPSIRVSLHEKDNSMAKKKKIHGKHFIQQIKIPFFAFCIRNLGQLFFVCNRFFISFEISAANTASRFLPSSNVRYAVYLVRLRGLACMRP